MALTKTQVSELYVAIFGRASEGEGNKFWQTVDASAAEIADEMLTTAPAQEYFGETLNSPLEFIKHIYLNTLGRTYEDDAEGIDYWSGRLEAGESHGAIVVELISVLQNTENTGDAQDSFKNRVEVSNYTADNLFAVPADVDTALSFSAEGLNVNEDPATVAAAVRKVDAIAQAPGEEPGQPGVEGETILLTDGREGSGRDVLTGTDGDDTFVGLVGQNQSGAVANAFSTGDWIDGGAGRDTIKASMINDNETGEAPNDVQAPRPITENVEEVYIEALEDVALDATRMEGVEEFWSDFSRGDMTFTGVNLRGSNLNITKDVTFGIKDTMHGTDFNGLFDSLSLTREAPNQSNSQLLVRIADVSTETPDTPLANVNLNLSFDLGEDTITLENVQSTDGTYAGLVTAINNALALEGYANLTVELSTPYNQVTFAGNTVNLPFVAQEVLLTDPAGNEFSNISFTQSAIQPVAGGFLVAGNASAVPPGTSSNLIESNLVLDNAGNGSTAGDVLIGGMSNSGKGVELFNVAVDRDSKINSLNTTTNGQTASNTVLKEIHISSLEDQGDLWIGSTQQGLNKVDANAFTGSNLSLGEGADVVNLKTFDASGSAANITLEADYNGNGLASSAQAFAINTGTGNDKITADLTGTSSSTSTQASLTVTSAGGNNTVVLSSDATEVNKATVTLGAGADTVTGGMTHLTVSTGAGNDVIYAENTGAKAVASLAANSAFATTYGLSTAAAVSYAELLNGREVQVTLTVPGITNANQFVQGFEAKGTVQASSGVLTTERDLYEAVAKVINDDPVMNKLAKASVTSTGTLVVTYLVDGETVATDEMVNFRVLGAWTDTGNQNTRILNALREKNSDSTIADADLAVAFNAMTDSATPTTAVAVSGGDVLAEYTVTLTGDVADNVSTIVQFTIDGNVGTVTGLNLAGGSTAAQIATALDTLTVTVNGIVYDIAASGDDVTLTAQTANADNNGAISIEAANGTGPFTAATAAAPTTAGAVGGNGSDSTVGGGVNVVNAGAGSDVIVLSSDDATIDTVKLDGQFGTNTIVHFNDGANGDVLDFTAYLTTLEHGVSTSTESQVRIATTLNADAVLEANEVSVLKFDSTANANQTFEGLTAANLLAALNNNTTDYASFTSTTLNSAAATVFPQTVGNIVGNSYNSIILVENDLNLGEYKVFNVTTTSTSAATNDFASIELVGTLDFGASVSLVLDNIA